MPFDTSQQGEYLTSQWLQRYYPGISAGVRSQREHGFLLRKIRDPRLDDFPVMLPQNRGGPLSLPQPVNYSAPTVATSYMGNGLNSHFTDGRSGFETGPSGTISNQMSDDWVSTSSAYSTPAASTSGADPTTGGGDTPSGNSTEPSGTSAVVITTGDGPRPPTPSPTPPAPTPPSSSAPTPLPSSSDYAQNFCGDPSCEPEYPGAISVLIDEADGHDLIEFACPPGYTFIEAFDTGWYIYSDACKCYGKDAVCPPGVAADCWGLGLNCFKQRDEYNLDGVQVDSQRGAFEVIVKTNFCGEGYTC